MAAAPDSAQHPLFRLIEIMAALRAPESGCPWDLEQTFATIAPYTVEEAYEVADAIERNDLTDQAGGDPGGLRIETHELERREGEEHRRRRADLHRAR